MKLTQIVFALALLGLSGASVARADNPTPPPQPASSPVPPAATVPPVTDATSPPVSQASAEPGPSADTSPVAVAPESGSSAASTAESGPGAPTGQSTVPGSQAVEQSGAHRGVSTGATSSSSTSNQSAASAQSPGVTLAPGLSSGQSQALDTGITDPNAYAAPSTAASTPAQLTCTSKNQATSPPFLVSPYSGWTEVNSFLDHDSPDYTVDGKIVIANGLTADAAQGAASDLFPAYWSPTLRQYVNYDGHNGYDFGLSYQPVLAAAAGVVSFAGWNGPSEYDGYGQMVLIRHRNGYVTLYGHLSELKVKTGQKVSAGQVLGISGTTGHSSGPHLHFSVFHNCNVVDPYGWTGHGPDPLQAFDGEQSTYLWLPGHDPLVLNPPPHWPAYPSGLHVSFPGGIVPVSKSGVSLPPVDRLLLLKLPSPAPGQTVSPGIALSRTEAGIGQEIAALVPYLDDLKARGLVHTYQSVPAMAAVWVRGTAPSSLLEQLPGIASLSGVAPHDLAASQAGLAHAVLIQIGPQQAPSLWPVGFRSALHAWRPVVDVVNGGALVAGLALPGQAVVVSLRRGNLQPGAAQAAGDPETGGFVAMIHDGAGNPVTARSGDAISVVSGGRRAGVRVQRLSIHATSTEVTGLAPSGATVPVSLAPGAGPIQETISTAANSSGSIRLPVASPLSAGTLAVATVVDGAGDQESALSFAPGLIVREGSPSLVGWASGGHVEVQIIRGGRAVWRDRVQPGLGGTFVATVLGVHRIAGPRAGDIVAVSTGGPPRRIVLPRLAAALQPGARSLQVSGPADAHLRLTYSSLSSSVWSRDVLLPSTGKQILDLGKTFVKAGDRAAIAMRNAAGDSIEATSQALFVTANEGTSSVSGWGNPGSSVHIQVTTASGAALGSANTSATESGQFSATVHDLRGHVIDMQADMRLIVRSGASEITVPIPVLLIRHHDGARALQITSAPHQSLFLTLKDVSGTTDARHVTTDASGQASIGTSSTLHIAQVTVSDEMPSGLTIRRTETVVRPHRSLDRSTSRHRNS